MAGWTLAELGRLKGWRLAATGGTGSEGRPTALGLWPAGTDGRGTGSEIRGTGSEIRGWGAGACCWTPRPEAGRRLAGSGDRPEFAGSWCALEAEGAEGEARPTVGVSGRAWLALAGDPLPLAGVPVAVWRISWLANAAPQPRQNRYLPSLPRPQRGHVTIAAPQLALGKIRLPFDKIALECSAEPAIEDASLGPVQE